MIFSIDIDLFLQNIVNCFCQRWFQFDTFNVFTRKLIWVICIEIIYRGNSWSCNGCINLIQLRLRLETPFDTIDHGTPATSWYKWSCNAFTQIKQMLLGCPKILFLSISVESHDTATLTLKDTESSVWFRCKHCRIIFISLVQVFRHQLYRNRPGVVGWTLTTSNIN